MKASDKCPLAENESAWQTWRKAGEDFARLCREKQVSVAPMGEECYRYSISRGVAHPEIVRRAFLEGYYSV